MGNEENEEEEHGELDVWRVCMTTDSIHLRIHLNWGVVSFIL